MYFSIFMFSSPGIFSTSPLTAYDNLVLSKNPIVYFPLNTDQFTCPTWEKRQQVDFHVSNYSSYTNCNDQLVKGAGNGIVFNSNQSKAIALDKTTSSLFNLQRTKAIEYWFKYSHNGSIQQQFFADEWVNLAGTVQISCSAHHTSVSANLSTRGYVGSYSGGWRPVTNNAANRHDLTNNEVYHVVATISSASTPVWTIYFNGTQEITFTASALNKATGNLFVGKGHDYRAWNYPISPMSNFALYDRVLTEAEITAHYNAGTI